jgi:hypothetical protein
VSAVADARNAARPAAHSLPRFGLWLRIFFWRGSITTIPIPRSDDERADHVPTDDPGAVIDLLARAGADMRAISLEARHFMWRWQSRSWRR